MDAYLVLINCKIINNHTVEGSGGGIFNVTLSNILASLTLVDCTILHNSAQFGGGIANNNAALYIRRSKIACNHSSLDGGGIHSLSGTNSISCSTLSNNIADRRAGGFGNNVGSLTILNEVKIKENSAISGGGIFNGSTEIDSSIILFDCCLHKNNATQEGGGLFNDTGASATIAKSKVTKNAAQIIGGGILNNVDGILDLIDTQVKENSPDNVVDL